jgi:hypothetical protein
MLPGLIAGHYGSTTRISIPVRCARSPARGSIRTKRSTSISPAVA